MVDPYEVAPIISFEGYGDASAVFVCEKLGITSFNDKAKLAQAKDETYLKGFTTGVMTIGPYAGRKVSEAKPLIKDEMIAAGMAHLYFEPESRVVSRTNDECVVASTDQWYLAYGEESWCTAVKNHILDAESFNAYDPSSLEKYESTLGWLKEWACTRQFGLGTCLPWDTQWVIESLSDSMIYMGTVRSSTTGFSGMEGCQLARH
jgi:leucyl-tRNA synthetase